MKIPYVVWRSTTFPPLPVRFSRDFRSAYSHQRVVFRSGKWAQIKAHYGIELADRSAINIKDRWRTLNKLGLN